MADYERDGNGAETEPSQRAPPHAPLGMWTLLEKNGRKSRAKALAHAHPASATASSATTQRGPQGTARGMGRLALSADWSHQVGGWGGVHHLTRPLESPRTWKWMCYIPHLLSTGVFLSICLLVAPVRKHLLSPCRVPLGPG